MMQRLSNIDSRLSDFEFPQGALMPPAALLDHRNQLPQLTVGFEVAEQNDVVGQIAGVERRTHRRSQQAALRNDEEGRDAAVAEIDQQFVKLSDQEALFRHGMKVAVETIDNDQLHALALAGLGGPADFVGELARGKFGRIDRTNFDHAIRDMAAQRRADAVRPLQHGSRSPRLGGFLHADLHLPGRRQGSARHHLQGSRYPYGRPLPRHKGQLTLSPDNILKQCVSATARAPTLIDPKNGVTLSPETNSSQTVLLRHR